MLDRPARHFEIARLATSSVSKQGVGSRLEKCPLVSRKGRAGQEQTTTLQSLVEQSSTACTVTSLQKPQGQ